MKQALTFAAAVAIASSAFAVPSYEICYDASIPLATTNWDDSISIPKFDPGIGTLLAVHWDLTGYVEGNASFESLDAEPATITMNLQATVSLFAPDNSQLDAVIPVVQTVDNVTAYDGVTDFGGTSGKAYLGINDSENAQNSSSDPGVLAQFTGLGNVALPVTATGSSNASGAGNLLTLFETAASAQVEICYEYIPEPASLSLLALGGLALLRRR